MMSMPGTLIRWKSSQYYIWLKLSNHPYNI